jgi:glutamine cyclotransferase
MLVLPLLFACSDAPQGQWARGPRVSTAPPPQQQAAVSTGALAGRPDRQQSPEPSPPVYTFKVRKSFPHDPAAFTQGLVLYDGALFESTGLYGASSLRKVDLQTGRVLRKIDVPAEYFAEGMTIFQGKIFQLTWKAHKGFTYDPKSFEKTGEFAYEGEGWGLTHDDRFLIMSDGTNQIRFLDPSNFEVVRTIKVFDAARPLMELNELEYIKGEIYANVWQTDRIARIAPASGEVREWIDLHGLLEIKDNSQPVDVLNGIAYDEATDRLFVTGKLWPKLFEIQLKKKGSSQ